MTPAKLAEAVLAAAQTVFAGRGLDATVLPAATSVERPRNPEHGDYAANLALQLAKRAGVNPRELAGWIAAALRTTPGVAEVEVAGPGFLNIRLDSAAAGETARAVVLAGGEYGRSARLAGHKINLEFVSANPTGPLVLASGRWAAVGDALARLCEAEGAEVTREYYFNDAGTQIERYAASLYAVARGEPVPADGYHGAYMADVAAAVVQRHPDVLSESPDKAREIFRNEGLNLMFDEIKRGLHEFGVDFAVFFSERSVHESGAIDHAIARLRELGRIYEADGAAWLRTTDLGDDKDRPVIRSDGTPAYIAGDLAYYLNKRERGFDRCIILLGADHHGYVGRLMAMCAAFGDKPGENLEVLIGQMISLLKDGELVRMSKRAGAVVLIDDLVEAVGVDAARYALARYSMDSPIELDLDLWTRRKNDNPVWYVQYVGARTASVSRNAADVGVTRGTPEDFKGELLTHEKEAELLLALGEYPRVVATASELREPHRVARYLEDLAGTYHRFYDNCRVLPRGDETVTDLHRARLWLNDATRVVIANGLGLLGVSAPERM